MAHFPEDQELLQNFWLEGTREKAFTLIIKKYQEKLYWPIRRMVVNHEDANDILQNVFIKVWKSLNGFRSESSLYTWLYRITINETLSFLKKESTKLNVSLDDHDRALQLKNEPEFDARKLEWKLAQAIQLLPEKQRMVFNLRYYDEMPYATMSEILETSEGSLKASYHHAAKKIEEYIINN